MANNKMQLDKNLGQHFLKNAGIVEKIIDRVRYLAPHKEPAKNQIIEVGPGGGALTYKLLEAGFSVLAIELDRRWIENLEKTCTKICDTQCHILHNKSGKQMWWLGSHQPH